ncbi:homeobox-leucine zipper protein ROC5-like [Curcuma longa]|uniref:homeobox-leucine zipper protein ROC5-like n=1 Tax=Curcuma longa TaxID=136217 RepID=UPI003D9F3310
MREEEEAAMMSFGVTSNTGRPSGSASYGQAAAATAAELTPPTQLRFATTGVLSLRRPNVDVQNNEMMAGAAGGSRRGLGEYSGSRNREDEGDSRSGNGNLDISGDDADQASNSSNRRRRKPYNRHTSRQIQELEAMFKECPHPDEKQREELSRRLRLDPRQVKFWFQNRRTQMKTQIERYENSMLRQENEKLRNENIHYREATLDPRCIKCGASATLAEISSVEEQLWVENASLKEELDRMCTLTGRFLGKSFSSLSINATSPMPSNVFEFGASVPAANSTGPSMPPSTSAVQPPVYGTIVNPVISPPTVMQGSEQSFLVELAQAAMEELVTIAQMEEPLWLRGFDGVGETLNYDQYNKCRRITGLPSVGYTPEATKETGVVLISAVALVDTLMDAYKWVEMFPCIVAKATVDEVVIPGVGGTREGALQIMQAELQALSPLVAVRELRFLRFCKQQGEGTWAVVDVSVDSIRNPGGQAPASFRRLPSGCLVQDMPNGYSKVTWVEHTEYVEEQVSQMYQQHLRSGMAFGAGRWVASLRRRCEVVGLLMSSSRRELDSGMAFAQLSMLKLAQKMTRAFAAGVCASAVGVWRKVDQDNRIGEGDLPSANVKTRKSLPEEGELPGIVLCASTAVWMPVAPRRLFDFLRDGSCRSQWDVLGDGGQLYNMAHVATGNDDANAVVLLRTGTDQQLIIQETTMDASGEATVIYAPVDVTSMHHVMNNGGDTADVGLLPCGFAILPAANSGSLLTMEFQLSQRTASVTPEAVEKVTGLLSRTLQKIQTALNLNTN